jgi:hypothetical protein
MPDEFECSTYYHFNLKFSRMIEEVLIPSSLKVKIEFMHMDTAGEDDIEKAFMKIRYWLDNVLENSIVFSHDNVTAIRMFLDAEGSPRLSNMLVLAPEDPDDAVMAALIQAKLQALATGALAFGPVYIEADNSLGVSFEFFGDSSNVLPSSEEWLDERRYFEEPWWNRDDGSTLDTIPDENADLSIKPGYAFKFDFLEPKKPVPSNGSIIRHEFRPQVHDGGKIKD